MCGGQTTLGPRGKNVVLWRDVGFPEVVNDGVTIARDISLAGTAQGLRRWHS
jgi:chaperonin GroEL